VRAGRDDAPHEEQSVKRAIFLAVVIACLSSLFIGAAEAQSDIGVRRFGIRGGLTVDPDQGHLGVHVNAGEFSDNLRFQPSFELGFGDDRVVAAINLDALYTFDPRPLVPYLGAGLGVAVTDRDGDDDANVDAGLNIVGGFEWGDTSKYLLEARVGIGDIPEFKLTIGLNF
jgi:hypothetical protein